VNAYYGWQIKCGNSAQGSRPVARWVKLFIVSRAYFVFTTKQPVLPGCKNLQVVWLNAFQATSYFGNSETACYFIRKICKMADTFRTDKSEKEMLRDKSHKVHLVSKHFF